MWLNMKQVVFSIGVLLVFMYIMSMNGLVVNQALAYSIILN